MNKSNTAFIIPVLLALIASISLVLAYPAITIVTDGNTYTTSTANTRTVVTTDNSNPYVSGAEYTYWPNTYDYVDGYRDGYVQSRGDRYDSRNTRYSYNRYDTNRYNTYGYNTYGLDCTTRSSTCLYRYTPCGSSWCRFGDTTQRQWYDDRYVVLGPYMVPHYGYAVNSQYLAERDYYW